ncbi:unnamed protein product [Fraxinus pennsylvanica]|uniref:Uncharacterized protein n=1 Tax=Fraxinus pennsylvanica TaxID=56036 RepID=A0AAD2E3H4_9LAMI|nr:unnamed protein product [Fraxinus pennsylvanica]
MGLFTYIIAGGSFILIGAWESFISTSEILVQTPSSSSQSNKPTTKTRPCSSSVTFSSISVLAFLFIINSFISLSDALNTKDNTGFVLQLESRGNYTVKCKGHPEYHRGRAIATLQFNCHLALLVTLIVGIYSIICKKNGIGKGFMLYRPLGDGGEMKQFDSKAQFTLDTDEEEEGGNEIKEVRDVELQKAIVVVPESGVNGYGTH